MSQREALRQKLPPHPTARHTWAKDPEVSEFAYFDEMPMRADSELFEPTSRPRHRDEDTVIDPWLSGSTADEARVMRQDDAATTPVYRYGTYKGDTVRVLAIVGDWADIVHRGGQSETVKSRAVANVYLGTPLPVFS